MATANNEEPHNLKAPPEGSVDNCIASASAGLKRKRPNEENNLNDATAFGTAASREGEESSTSSLMDRKPAAKPSTVKCASSENSAMMGSFKRGAISNHNKNNDKDIDQKDGDEKGTTSANGDDYDEGQADSKKSQDEELKSPPEKETSSILLRGPSGIDCVDFPVSNLRNHLICPLCKGYFRDPYTVSDCLHSFCRSCLFLSFRMGTRRCPTCNISLEPDPFREILADRTLQELVDKIFPWMRGKEEEEEKEFYARRGIELKPEYAEEEKKSGRGGKGSGKSSHGGKSSLQSLASSQVSMSDMLDLQLEPDDNASDMKRMPPLRNPMLRTSGRLKILSLKKYLIQRLGLKDSATPAAIEILCNGDPMGDELSLTFILRTRWFCPSKVLTLTYCLEEEYTNKIQSQLM